MVFYHSNSEPFPEKYWLALPNKTLGEILQEAGLVSPHQIKSALLNQITHPDLRIGEILTQQELVKPETVNFFVQDWSNMILEPEKNALGYYLRKAGILNSAQIELILAQQRVSGIRFGTVAVFQGFIRSTTLDFFLENLFPDEAHRSPFIDLSKRTDQE